MSLLSLPFEMIVAVAEKIPSADAFPIALVCKEFLDALIVAKHYDGPSLRFFTWVKKHRCTYCNYPKDPDHLCSLCVDECDCCQRRVPRALLVEEDYAQVCLFGCRFTCNSCNRVFPKRNMIMVTRDDDVYCGDCGSDREIYGKLEEVVYGKGYADFSQEHIDRWDPEWKSTFVRHLH